MSKAKHASDRVVICGAARTPIGVKCGTLSHFSAEDLAVLAGREALHRGGLDPQHVDAAIGANVYQFTAPGVQDIYFPRNVALRCGLADDVPALMVQRICGSGLQTIVCGFQQIALPPEIDDTRVALCFGGETMSRCPRIDRAPRHSAAHFWEFAGNGRGGAALEDTILASLRHDLAETAMMLTADEYGARMGITRRECDAFAALSQQRAHDARRASHFNGGDALRGMFPLQARDETGQPVRLARDECVRQTSLEALEKLPGITPHKLVSAGNASEIADGAAAVVIASRHRAEELGVPAQFEIVSYGIAGVDPKIMGRGPVPAAAQALRRARLEATEIDLWEINEAFAAQYLGVEKELGLPRERVNVNGGAIAIGHPLAATGTRVIVDLMYELDRRQAAYGLASACIGGGQGVAIILRNTQAAGRKA